MKIINTLTTIVSLSLSVSSESPVSKESNKLTSGTYAKPSSLSGKGLATTPELNTGSSKEDVSSAIADVKVFLKTNPTIIKSVLKVANQPKHKKAKEEVVREAIKIYSEDGGKLDIPSMKAKAINFVYEHPEVLSLAQQATKQVVLDHSTLFNNIQLAIESLAKQNPKVFRNLQKDMINFAEEHSDEYEKEFEMLLKSAVRDPKLAAKIAKSGLKITKAICEASSSEGCACDGAEGAAKVNEPVATKEIPEVESPSIPNVEVEEPAVDSVTPELEEADQPEELSYARPDTKVEEPEVESPKPAPEELGYARPGQ